jgi:hypothetical protein
MIRDRAPTYRRSMLTVTLVPARSFDMIAEKVTFPRKSGHRVTRISPLPAVG